MKNFVLPILIADDDDEDLMMATDALREARVTNEIHTVGDGQELLDYLNRVGGYAIYADTPWPAFILLDLNMPRMDGREALTAIKENPAFRKIPVVALTTSRAEEDIVRTYELGINSFVIKPITFQGLVDVMSEMKKYWIEIVELPAA